MYPVFRMKLRYGCGQSIMHVIVFSFGLFGLFGHFVELYLVILSDVPDIKSTLIDINKYNVSPKLSKAGSTQTEHYKLHYGRKSHYGHYH